MSEERELYELRYQVECMVPIMERIATALEKLAPQGSEREQIALRLFVHLPKTMADRCYGLADMWIAERDKQRVAQADQGRVE